MQVLHGLVELSVPGAGRTGAQRRGGGYEVGRQHREPRARGVLPSLVDDSMGAAPDRRCLRLGHVRPTGSDTR